MNFINNTKYVVNCTDLQKVFLKFEISCSKPIDNEEFVKAIHEITQTVSTYTSDGTTYTSNG